MEVLTGCLFGLVAALCGFIVLHFYAAWSIRNIDRERETAGPYQPTTDEPNST